MQQNAQFSEAVRATGVLTPAVIFTPDRSVTAEVAEVPVRVYEWIDLGRAERGVDPAIVGQLTGRLHRAAPISHAPIDPWHTEGVGSDGWRRLIEQAGGQRAPFTSNFARRSIRPTSTPVAPGG